MTILYVLNKVDLCLTRRLYAWLLGSDVNVSQLSSEHPLVKRSKSSESLATSHLYFEMYSREMLVQVCLFIMAVKL